MIHSTDSVKRVRACVSTNSAVDKKFVPWYTVKYAESIVVVGVFVLVWLHISTRRLPIVVGDDVGIEEGMLDGWQEG